jgi:hypothetical protein
VEVNEKSLHSILGELARWRELLAGEYQRWQFNL